MNTPREFFQTNETKEGMPKSLKVERTRRLLMEAGVLSALLMILFYVGVKRDYADIRGSSGVVRVYTINRLTGVVCETSFLKPSPGQRDRPIKVCR